MAPKISTLKLVRNGSQESKSVVFPCFLPGFPFVLRQAQEFAGPKARVLYQDEEGDYITMSSDTDVAHAVELCKTNVLTLVVDDEARK